MSTFENDASDNIARVDFIRFREFLTRHHPERLADLTPSTKPLLREVYKEEFLDWWASYLLAMGAPIPLENVPTDVRNHVIDAIIMQETNASIVGDDG